MNFIEATFLAAMTRWDDANPYDDKCDDTRCVKGRRCPDCNPEEEYIVDPNEYTGCEDV